MNESSGNQESQMKPKDLNSDTEVLERSRLKFWNRVRWYYVGQTCWIPFSALSFSGCWYLRTEQELQWTQPESSSSGVVKASKLGAYSSKCEKQNLSLNSANLSRNKESKPQRGEYTKQQAQCRINIIWNCLIKLLWAESEKPSIQKQQKR